jgi:DEAD/DEAH box helicase domain-containing protein
MEGSKGTVKTPRITLGEPSRPAKDAKAEHMESVPHIIADTAPHMPSRGRFGVLDVETSYSATEAGGWHRADRMGISVAVLYDSGPDTFTSYTQDEIPALAKCLAELDLVVGFQYSPF